MQFKLHFTSVVIEGFCYLDLEFLRIFSIVNCEINNETRKILIHLER